jgi:hypothetical protein
MLERLVGKGNAVTLVTRIYQDKDDDKRKFPQVIMLVGDRDSGDLEWLTEGLLGRCPVLYSLGKEILERIRSDFPPGELKKAAGQYSYEYRNLDDNFWTVATQPFGTFAAAHNQAPPEPALKFSLYGRADGEQGRVRDRFTEELTGKSRDSFGASYCELKVRAAADIPDLMKRLRLAYELKHSLFVPSYPSVPD